MRRGRGQRQRPCSVPFCQRQTSVAFQCSRHTAPMPPPSEDFHGFAECRASSQMASLLTVDVAQICQRPRRTPRVFGFPKGEECTFVQSSSGSHVARLPRDITLLVDRPGGSAAIPQFLKDLNRFTQRPSGAWIVAADLEDIGKIVKTTRDCQPIRQQTPAREAPLKIALRRGVVTSISRRYRQSIQGRGDARLIAQFYIKREALFQRILGSQIIALSGRQGPYKDR